MRTRRCALGVGLALALVLSACANESKSTDLGAEGQPLGDAATTAVTTAAEDAVEAAHGPQNLMDPGGPLMNETAPDVFRARFETTAGTLVIEVTRAWAPNGADRFYNLVNNGFFDGSYFFRAIAGFMAQFGLPADPAVATTWAEASIPDDPSAGQSNKPGMVTFAKRGSPNSRSTQLFINFGNNANLDAMGFTPIGKVVDGMDAVNAIHTGYGESRSGGGMGPEQMTIQQRGSAYLAETFPDLTRIERASIVQQ